VIAVDATGIQVTNRGEWRRRKRKGYVKIHVAVDTQTKRAVSLEVSDERTHDGERLKPLVRGARRRARIRKVLGEGSYDTKEVFEFLGGQGIAAGIQVRQDSNPACEGARGEVVHAKKWERMVQELRLKVWVYNLLLGLTVGLTGTGAGA